ncbi:MAG TPA: hypothetical protein VNE61_10625 [Ktedonobacteraceae bacterium]|nr:hypothetical protein [Ktedonobacteraceae bacterium]
MDTPCAWVYERIVADAFGLLAGFWFAAALMIMSGVLVALLMDETLPSRRVVHPAWEQEPRFGASRPAMSREPGVREAGSKILMDDIGS